MGKSLRLLTAAAVILPVAAAMVSFSGQATAGSEACSSFNRPRRHVPSSST